MTATGLIPFTVFATLLVFFVMLVVVFFFIITLPKTDFKLFKSKNPKSDLDEKEETK